MKTSAQQEHNWLQQLVGGWEYVQSCVMGPDQPPSQSTGRTQIRSLGNLWILIESEFEMEPGITEKSIITLGYDPAKNRFIGTFVASMMTKLWNYEGTLEGGQRILTLEAQGPSFTGEGIALYQDIFEIVDKDCHLFRSRIQKPDGSWVQFMESTYTRNS